MPPQMQVCCYTNLSSYTLYHKMGVCVYVKEAYKTEKYVYFFDYITANVVCMLFTVAIRAIEIFGMISFL